VVGLVVGLGLGLGLEAAERWAQQITTVRQAMAAAGSAIARGDRPAGIGTLYGGGMDAHYDQVMQARAALAGAPSRLYFASGSRGTQAGLTLGAHLCNAPYRLHGVAVSAGEPEKVERARRVTREAAALLGAGESVLAAVRHRSGLHRRRLRDPDAEALEALLARRAHRGACSTLTYTAKAMAALIRHVRATARFHPEESIVFLHTAALQRSRHGGRRRAADRRLADSVNFWCRGRVQILSTLSPLGTLQPATLVRSELARHGTQGSAPGRAIEGGARLRSAAREASCTRSPRIS
jgi:hypothetical protein